MKNKNIKEICEKFWEIEKKYDLLKYEINNVKIWQYLRFDIYNLILQKKEIFGQIHFSKLNILDKLKLFPKYLKNSILYNPLRGNYKKEILIFDHKRKKKIDGKYVDIYTKKLIDRFKPNKIEVIEEPYNGKHYKESTSNRKYIDYLYLYNFLYKKVNTVNCNHREKKIIFNLNKVLEEEFDITLDLLKVFKVGIANFKGKYNFYKKILKKRNPKKIYLVVSYGKQPLIAAAKAKNIKVIEVQHGNISAYHLGYNFPHVNKNMEYFPDEFFTFGEFWKKNISFPISKNKIKNYGFKFLENNIKKYNYQKKEEDKIVILSQGSIGKYLTKIAFKLAKKIRNKRIYYKLHPSEVHRWEEDYKYLVQANKLKNFYVVEKGNLYRLLASAAFQIGVYSTAIYEGLCFNCKTILVDLPGISYMETLIKKNYVKKANSVDQIINIINNGKFLKKDFIDLFFKKT